MSIVLTHMLGETDDGVLDPKEHRKLQKECPGMKLPGVVSCNVYRDTAKRLIFGDVELENYAALDDWENWVWSPEGREWSAKFRKTGKFLERIMLEKMD